MKKHYLLIGALLLSFAFSIKGYAKSRVEYRPPNISNPTQVRLLAVGDNLIQQEVYEAAQMPDGTYDFHSMYRPMRYLLNKGDLKVINQETMLVNDPLLYSGFPIFGSPTAVGTAVKDTGFNVVTMATNHSLDKGETGILDSINFFSQYKYITLLGIHKSEQDAAKPVIRKVNGIRIGMLNYATSLNGFTFPEGKEYLVDYAKDLSKVTAEISDLRTKCDFVIVFPHWGTEYALRETKKQRSLAQTFANAGADLIIGGHPHVVEPLSYVETEDHRIVPVYYSLGNFVSNQQRAYRMLGAMARVTIEKKDGMAYIKKYDAIPLVTHIEDNHFSVYPLSRYTKELAQKHALKTVSIDYLKHLWDDVFTHSEPVPPIVKPEDNIKVKTLPTLHY